MHDVRYLSLEVDAEVSPTGKPLTEKQLIRQSKREGFKRIQMLREERERRQRAKDAVELIRQINSPSGQRMRNCRKRAHLTKKAALDELEKLKSHPSGKHSKLQRVYLCDRCYTWHLTTFNPKPWKWD